MLIAGRIIAFDVGDARVGVAVSDPLGMIAQPLCTVERQNGGVEKLIRLIVEKDAKRLVVVSPWNSLESTDPRPKKLRPLLKS